MCVDGNTINYFFKYSVCPKSACFSLFPATLFTISALFQNDGSNRLREKSLPYVAMISEVDGDDRRSLALMLLDLVRDFVFMAGRSIAGGDVFNKDCIDLIRRVALLIHLAEEIGKFSGESFEYFNEFASSHSSSSSTDSVTASSSDGLSELVAAIQAAKGLLYDALTFPRNDGSPVTDGAAKKLVFQFQYVTTRLENALENLPYDHFCISDEVQEQVDLVKAQLRRAAANYGSLTSMSELPEKKLNVRASGKWMTDFDVKNMGSVDEVAEKQHSDSFSDDCSNDVHSDRESDLASKSQDEIVIPENFCCPISNELMTDPVVVSTGQTYERSNIQRWIDNGNTICLKTQQQLQDLTLTPNSLLRRLITKWCIEHNIKLEPGLTNEKLNEFNESAIETPVRKLSSGMVEEKREAVTEIRKFSKSSTDHRAQIAEVGAIPQTNEKLNKFNESFRDICQKTVAIETLVRKLSSGMVEEKREAVTEIRKLSKSSTDHRVQIAEAGAIPHLVNLLTSDDVLTQENSISAILNLSLHEKSKKLIMISGAVPFIAQILKFGTIEGRESAAATIYSLSLVDENRMVIGASSGLIPDLLEVLKTGSLRGKKDAARALLNLCIYQGNKPRAMRAGIIKPLLKMLADESMVDEALYIMSVLCSHPEVKAAMIKASSMLALTNVLKMGSPRSKEHAAAVLLALYKGDYEKLARLSRLGAVTPLMELAKNGTERARRKATTLLEQLKNSC